MGPPGKPRTAESSGDANESSSSSSVGPSVSSPQQVSAFDETAELTPRPAPSPGPSAVAPPATEARAESPVAFGRYEVRQTLGTGGFGTVYLGHDTQLDRPVAIKVVRGGPGVPLARAEVFLQEARRLARLNHPGIVTVHDVGLQNGNVYIVSDYLEGPDLAEWLKHHVPSWQDSARIVAALADALAHAHSRLTVHRDVKPANVILTRDRGPVLVDFGLGLDDAVAGGPELGVISGTPAYMAPEQVAGVAHRIDGRTDVYSLGVVFYQMLCGRVPFRSGDMRELLRQVRDDEPQPPRQLVRDLPPELERACLKAMAKKLQDRYSTAADFATDLRRTEQSTAGPISLSSSWFSAAPAQIIEPHSTGTFLSQQSALSQTSSRRRARDAERRQVTVLVCGCDTFESDAYLEFLDAEGQADVLRDFQQACEEAVRPFDGTVLQCNEHGLIVCFGYPVAHEDAAQLAARAGLALLEAMKELASRLSREHRLEVNPRVGIHTGPAVVETGEEVISLVGEARNVAVRLEDAALPGQVLITAATRRLIRGHFEGTSLGPRKLKGVAQPVDLFLVHTVGAHRNVMAAGEIAGLTPLLGRDHEVSLLKDRWEQAQEGTGQVVLIIGEPGLGKSRLVHTMKQYVRGQAGELGSPVAAATARSPSAGARAREISPVIGWRCSPHYQNTGLHAVGDYFERSLGFGPAEPPTTRLDRLVRHLGEFELDRPDIVPLFASLLNLPPDERYPLLGLPPVREREETFRALREWFHAYSERQTVLFVVEDLHWIDASTLEFLGQFLAEGLYDRVLTLLTFRPEFQAPWPAVANQTTLALNRLTRRQVSDLIAQKTRTALPESAVEQIYDRTGGVPLFVEEFTKLVQESGMLDQAAGDSTRLRSLLAHEIPATLQDLVTARLDRMDGDREVAQLAATLGREFRYELLAAVAAIDEASLQAELGKLVQAEILYAKGRPPRCSYIFKHALLEDALYNGLVKSKRQQFHRRIAEAMESSLQHQGASQPELLAHHFTEAGLTDRAIDYWLKAGLRSRERSAEIEAIGHLRKGLELLESLEESPARDARQLELLGPLGVAYLAVRGYAAPEVGPVFRQARELCERAGQSKELFALLLGIWEWHTVRGDLRLCAELAVEGIEFAERSGDPGIMMEALFMPGETMLYRADFAGARDRFATAVAEFDDRERTKLWAAHTGHDAGVTHRSNLAVCLWHLGYPDQAMEANREMCQLAREIGHPFSVAYALHHTAWLNCCCRLGREAQAAAEELIALATEQGFALWRATGTYFRGAGVLLQGRREEALPLLLAGIEAFRATGAELTLTFQFATVGDAYTQAGRFDLAHQALAEGLAIAEKNDERCHEAEIYRLKGELLLAEAPDQAAAADECFHHAIELARRQQSKGWELRATMSLARLRRQQERRREAHELLAAKLGAYTEGWATPDFIDARKLLESLG
jgi:serine/threonine protein kinase/tetratricopeptide (TPR) repeat protein